TGLVLATWIQTLWPWRPQVSITGASRAGKSTLFDTVSGLFGKLTLASSGSTAAGIRQATKSSAKVIFVDEFEAKKHRAEVLEMLRSSGGGTPTLRGTTKHRSLGFKLRHIVWVAGIESGLRRDRDRTRFIGLELVKLPPDQHGGLEIPSEFELADLGQR